MNTESYRFQLGSLTIYSLSDGHMGYPPGHLFANVPKAQIEGALRERGLPVDCVRMAYTCLFVNTGEHRVLVDIGAGKMSPSTGRLRQNLQAAGIEPADVDTVVITHAHPAHVGGTLDDEGQPVYTNARYYLWKEEWEFWTSEAAFARASERQVAIARANLEPIRDRLTLLDGEAEIVPGIRVLPAPGHTPGHVVVSVSSGSEVLLYIADTVLHPLHLEYPDWCSIYDMAPEQARASKRHIFDLAAEIGAWVIGQHFSPFPSLGHVVKSGEGWQWRPFERIGSGRRIEFAV